MISHWWLDLTIIINIHYRMFDCNNDTGIEMTVFKEKREEEWMAIWVRQSFIKKELKLSSQLLLIMKIQTIHFILAYTIHSFIQSISKCAGSKTFIFFSFRLSQYTIYTTLSEKERETPNIIQFILFVKHVMRCFSLFKFSWVVKRLVIELQKMKSMNEWMNEYREGNKNIHFLWLLYRKCLMSIYHEKLSLNYINVFIWWLCLLLLILLLLIFVHLFSSFLPCHNIK